MFYKLNKLVVQIRKAKLEDIPHVMPIERNSFGKHHWSEQSFRDEFISDFSFYLVAVDLNAQKIIGYIGYWIIGNEGHITTLAVSHSYRRMHIADILLYNLIQHAIRNSINWLTLEVRVSNTPAVNLYSKFKFKSLGTRKKYYQDNNEDALVLWTEDINDPKYKTYLGGVVNDIVLDKGDVDKLQYINN